MLCIENLSFSYGKDTIPTLADINLKINPGEVVGLVGPNGSGKSTLLKCIDYILKPEGSVTWMGDVIGLMKLPERARRIAYVPQHRNPGVPISVFDMVLLGRRPFIGWRPGNRDIRTVSRIISRLDIEHLALRDVNTLSGGEGQIVYIARALAQQPGLLLLDEPTSSLDIKHQIEVTEIIRRIADEQGISVLMAIHDLNLASRVTDRLVFLHKGGIYDYGPPAEVLVPETIRLVYGIPAQIIHQCGYPLVVPERLKERN